MLMPGISCFPGAGQTGKQVREPRACHDTSARGASRVCAGNLRSGAPGRAQACHPERMAAE